MHIDATNAKSVTRHATGWTKAAVASTGETILEVLSMCRAVATAESRVYRELGFEQLYEGEAGSSLLK
ncbi:hypothetical protein OH76DRAFT_1406675 [Lentinus brumalis]|uniref:Uncharacterized protein n=1 Tax=Lentinus brumalis TaxID=2498619 RepID=A0A371D2S9_9APHY|nr:hypothetical protein OH76DRAFT_1406675 [Polyporus brumalis]